MPTIPRHRYVMFFLVATLGCAADLATKSWIFDRLGYPTHEPIWLVSNVLSLETSLNEGALFGIGQGFTFVFAALSIMAACWIGYWLFARGAANDVWLTLALACIMAGIFGNLYDRLGFPALSWPYATQVHQVGDPVFAVRDWIHFQYKQFDWPIFNIADSLLVCGAGLLVRQTFRAEAATSPTTPQPAKTSA